MIIHVHSVWQNNQRVDGGKFWGTYLWCSEYVIHCNLLEICSTETIIFFLHVVGPTYWPVWLVLWQITSSQQKPNVFLKSPIHHMKFISRVLTLLAYRHRHLIGRLCYGSSSLEPFEKIRSLYSMCMFSKTEKSFRLQEHILYTSSCVNSLFRSLQSSKHDFKFASPSRRPSSIVVWLIKSNELRIRV